MGQISLRVDDELKKDAEKVFDEIGLNTSAAINVFLKRLLEKIRFPLSSLQTSSIVKKTWQNWKDGLPIWSQGRAL